jgi:homocysteine S-methyltransferase
MSRALPDQPDLYLAYAGMETDLIFNRAYDLPGFAAYPMLESDVGRSLLRTYFEALIDLARTTGTGVILDSPTWVANRDRGAALGYTPDQLRDLNRDAVAMMARLRDAARGVPCVLSGNIGPRADAYAPEIQMSAAMAEAYHAEQIGAFVDTGLDIVSGYTLAYAAEAIGLALAARRADLPVVISFTVETDGRLPTGMTLADAIAEVDKATDAYPSHYMVNCAHPDHFDVVLGDDRVMSRLQGVVANASRCSHAELDEAEELDDGDPVELGNQLADLRRRFPHLRVLGGCCGTDLRHMAEIASSATVPLH